MSGLFGGGGGSAPPPQVTETQKKQEARAEAQTREEAAQSAARRRVQRTGGIRLLMSPARQEGPNQIAQQSTLGVGNTPKA